MSKRTFKVPSFRSHDDSELEHLIADSANRSTKSLILEQTMKLDTKSKQLENILGTVNAHIVNSTMKDVIRLKPIFDEEKLKLIQLRILVSKLYELSRSPTSEYVFVEMVSNTEFPEWNQISIEVNKCSKMLKHYLSEKSVVANDQTNINEGEVKDNGGKRSSWHYCLSCLRTFRIPVCFHRGWVVAVLYYCVSLICLALLLFSLTYLFETLSVLFLYTQTSFLTVWYKVMYRPIQAYNQIYIENHYTPLIPNGKDINSLQSLRFITNTSDIDSANAVHLLFDQDANTFWSSASTYRKRSGKYVGRQTFHTTTPGMPNNPYTRVRAYLRSSKHIKGLRHGIRGEWVSITVPSYAQSPLLAYRIQPSDYDKAVPYSWCVLGHSLNRRSFELLDCQDTQVFVSRLHWKLYQLPAQFTNVVYDQYYLVVNRIAYHGGKKNNAKTFVSISGWDLYTYKDFVPKTLPIPQQPPPTTPMPTTTALTIWKKGISDLTVPATKFTITFRVKFYDFNNDYPICITTETNAFQCHGFGPVYGSDQGYLSLYIFTNSGVGPHGRGIKGYKSEGCLKSAKPLSLNTWYNVQLVKTERSLSLIVDGLETTEYIDSTISDKQFLMKPPGRLILGKNANGDRQNMFNGEIANVQVL